MSRDGWKSICSPHLIKKHLAKQKVLCMFTPAFCFSSCSAREVSVCHIATFISQEMQKSFDRKDAEMLQEAMNRLHPEVSVFLARHYWPRTK